MNWNEVKALIAGGWQIGAHIHTHPNLSELSQSDPSGESIRWEMDTNNNILEKELSFRPKDIVFKSTTWSSMADLMGISEEDEIDGGPPHSARYMTENTDLYKIPAIELKYLIHSYDAFRFYLSQAINE